MNGRRLAFDAVNAYGPQALAQRAGNRDWNGPRQFYAPPPIILATNSGVGESTYTTTILVPTPDSRCRVKISILFIPTDGQNTDDITGSPTLWLAACEKDTKGVGGGRYIPVTNLVGTSAAPAQIPTTAGLLGYSREFVTAADAIQGVFATSSLDPTPGMWVLQSRIQPDAVSLEWGEWDEIRRLFLPVNLGATGSL